ncbi:MAG: hypothetical protein OEW99_06345, partial [Gammaproteobacteria bacterium]|nr:hypothetical protein [Gammaproteobacteria bacterium]
MRMRNIFILFIFLSAYLTSAIAAPSLIPAPPRVNAKAYLLIDHNSGHILAEHNADNKIEPASLTKLMTAYVVLFEI